MISKDVVLGDFATRFINAKVRQLIGRAGFNESDRDDLRQSFCLNFLQRRERFDPEKANWEGFVVMVCENFSASLLRRQLAEKRTTLRECMSLDQSSPSGQSIGSLTADNRVRRHRQVVQRSGPSQWELSEDTRAVLADMPPMMRKTCEILMRDSKKTAEHELNMSHGALYELLDRALKRFEKANMVEHLKI